MAHPPLLIVPGRGGSGAGHWQSLWAEQFAAVRVQQREWEAPVAADWIETLDAAIAALPAAPVIIAHSLGCILIAYWAQRHSRPVRGAMLVAPPDTDSDLHTAPEAHVFRPVPRQRLPFPSIVVASTTDPRCDISRARTIAANWGADFCDIGDKGHINIAAGFGPWPEGEDILYDFLAGL